MSTHPERSTADPGIPSQVPLPHAELKRTWTDAGQKLTTAALHHSRAIQKEAESITAHRSAVAAKRATFKRNPPTLTSEKKSRSGVTSEKKSRFLPFYFLGHVLGCYAFALFWALFLDQHCHPGQVIRSDCVNGWKTKK